MGGRALGNVNGYSLDYPRDWCILLALWKRRFNIFLSFYNSKNLIDIMLLFKSHPQAYNQITGDLISEKMS